MADGSGLNEGRLSTEKHWTNIRYSVEPKLERENSRLENHLRVDRAHVVMLTETGIITPETARALLVALRNLENQGFDPTDLDPQRGSLVSQIEHRLSSAIGSSVAHRLHTGRSRNDLHEAIYRLSVRDALLQIVERTQAVVAGILARSRETRDAWIPAFTHLQRAMPTTLGHYWLRHCYVLLRDLERLQELYQRVDLSALGGAALVGTTWPIDRRVVASLLGHPDLVRHSTDAGIFGRDNPAEIAAVLSILVNDLARPMGDLYLWASAEFGFVEFADELCDTSSIMPQKKNPEAVERIRGIAGMAIGWLVGVLATQRSASSTDMDLVYGLDPTFGYLGETIAALDLSAVVVETTTFHLERMEEAARDSDLMATNVADTLVRLSGMAFRDAHQVVGRAVRLALETPGQANIDAELVAVAARQLGIDPPRINDQEIASAYELENFRAQMLSEGSMGVEPMEEMYADVEQRLAAAGGWLGERRHRIATADQLLADRVEHYVNESPAESKEAAK